jgi:alpha-D-xyloside xylohydrolase
MDNVITSKSDTELKISTGNISASVDLRPKSFNVDFHSHAQPNPNPHKPDSFLTKLGWRSVGHVKCGHESVHPNFSVHPHDMLTNPNKGERWLTMQFQLSVGEKIFGLGERFGPFVKNGQVCIQSSTTCS